MKIISGGQTGADVAGLMAGKLLGFETGGTMPKGFITLDGNRPEYAALYGIVEHKSDKYPPRTAANARDSDGTVRFARRWNTRGEQCTLKMIKQYKRPHFDADYTNPPDPAELHQWVLANNIQVLNVAGNSEQTTPGIQDFVVDYIVRAFTQEPIDD